MAHGVHKPSLAPSYPQWREPRIASDLESTDKKKKQTTTTKKPTQISDTGGEKKTFSEAQRLLSAKELNR